jgi:predicted site-specific integrase-resolvase
MVVANQLFDALTAANVPRDKAHAVVDALEHRMSSELATKADLEREIAGVKADLEREIAGVKADIAATRADLEREIAGLRAATHADLQRETAQIREEARVGFATIRKEMAELSQRSMIVFGGLQVTSLTIFFFALEYAGR